MDVHASAASAVSGIVFTELCQPELICKLLMSACLALPKHHPPSTASGQIMHTSASGSSPQGTSALQQQQLLHPPVTLRGGSSRVPA